MAPKIYDPNKLTPFERYNIERQQFAPLSEEHQKWYEEQQAHIDLLTEEWRNRRRPMSEKDESVLLEDQEANEPKNDDLNGEGAGEDASSSDQPEFKVEEVEEDDYGGE